MKIKNKVNRIKALPVSIGNISNEKLSQILLIRTKYIHFANLFTKENFKPCFFSFDHFDEPKKELIKEICITQKSIKKGECNKAYIEKARKEVSKVLWNRIVSGKKSFLKSIHTIDEKKIYSKKRLNILKLKNEAPRKYKHFPNDYVVSSDDLEFIKNEYKAMNSKERIQNTNELIYKKNNFNFTNKQIEIIKTLYNSTIERFEMPRFGYNDDFNVTIDLDYRIVKDYKSTIKSVGDDLNLFIDKENKQYHFFLEISDPVTHGKKIKIPLAIDFKEWQRSFSKESMSKSFSLVIKSNSIDIKHIIEKEKLNTSLLARYEELKQVDYLVGRDFGYKETISLSVIKNEFDLSINEFEDRLNLNKKETHNIYKNNYFNPNVVESLQFSGKKFLNKIKIVSKNIENISSHISKSYNKIDTLIAEIKCQLNLSDDVLISKKMKTNNSEINNKIDTFLISLKNIKKTKQKRRNMYKQVAGIKRSWFGFLSTQELKLVQKYRAALIVEDLTVMAAEKEKPDYKGKRFNKMINNGSKGQYMRISQEKMFWNGILEHRIPSYYSSTSCVKHSVVDKEMRKGNIFKCKKCNEVEDADIHASFTIPSFLMLKPLL